METSPHSLTVASLMGAADRYGGWRPPHGEARAKAIEELRKLAGTDAAPYAEAAGVLIGAHPIGTSSFRRYRNATNLLLAAGRLDKDDPRVQRWITVGRERRERGREAMRAGDHWQRGGW